MGVVYLGILLCAIAFAGVTIYISLVLKRVADTLHSLGNTLGEVEKELQHITPQLRETVYETDKIVDDMEEKLKATDSLFDTLENVGTSVNSVNQLYKNNSDQLTGEQLQKKLKPFIKGIKWSEGAFQVYSKWKDKRQSDKNELMVQDENAQIVPVDDAKRGDNR
ncbi:DUF948 domain-containing protein [Virgibacillus ainsalahensis]